MSIEVHDTTGESPLSGSEIMRIAQEALRQGGESELDLGVILVTGEALSQMHGRYLDDPTPTDVITLTCEETRLAKRNTAPTASSM